MKLVINSQDLGTIGSIDTYGMFTGDSVDESLINLYNEEHGTDYGYNQFEWSHDHENIVKDLAECSRNWLVDNVVGSVVKEIGHIEGTFSPREYNFQTDSWEAEWTIDEQALADYIEKNKADYDAWYAQNSWKEHIDWRENDDPKKQELIILAQLQFYLEHEFDSESYNYYMWEMEFDIYAEHTDMECLEENNEKGES